MSLMERLKAAFRPKAEGESLSMPDIRKGTELFEWLTGGMSSAGVAVTEQTAMRVSAVYACVNLVGGSIASLPLPVYRRTQDGRERADHEIWWMLNEQPHPCWGAATFWEYLTASKLLLGDAYARILRASRLSDRIVGFEPLHKSRITTQKLNGRLVYFYQEDDGGVIGIDQDDMLHIPGPGFDGLAGMSQIRHALRNSAGVALAADEFSASFFKNGARPDFALEVPGKVTPEQQDMIRKTWKDRHGGVENAHLPALMVGGAKIHELTMNAEDAQLLDTRRFQVEDIARVFGVPPHMIGHTDKTTSWGSGVEQMSIGFVKYTLQRHLVKFEQEINRKVWPNRERYYVEFNTAGLERGDYKSRNEGYRIAAGRAGEPGWMTINEIRRLENLPPIDGGDDLLKPEAPADPEKDPQVLSSKIRAAASVRSAELHKEAVAAAPAPVYNFGAPEININGGDTLVEQPKVQVDVHNDVPAQEAPVVNVAAAESPVINVAAPNVDAHFEATIPAPVVSVAAPSVNIVNDVQPAEIKEAVIAAMPDRVTTAEVQRDAQGNIIRSIQTEKDA